MAAFSPITTKLPQIPSGNFTKEKVLGKGGFGKVYFGRWESVPVAVKELLDQTISDTFIETFRSEAEMMASCQHPNIVRLYGACLEKGKLALLMEYLDKGDLYSLLKNTKISLPWPERFSIASDTAIGLSYLHNLKIVHRDLKSHNVLIAKDGTAKIADFGLAQIRLETASKTTNDQAGSISWMAPEQFSQQASANKKTDIYGFGMILWEIASRKSPFSQMTPQEIFIAKMKNTHETIPSNTPKNYANLIKNCWSLPTDRPSAKLLATELNNLKNPVAFPDIAFGKEEWAKYFGDIGIEPSLPSDIHTILKSACPFWPNKKVEETHILVLIPHTVNGIPLSLEYLGKLIQKPLQGNSTKYRGFNSGKYIDVSTVKSHWILLTRDVIKDSRYKSYSEKQALIETKAYYEMPTILDATVAIFLEYVRTGTRLYNDKPWTFTMCQEKYVEGRQLIVGGFSPTGLSVGDDFAITKTNIGVGALRKF